MKAVTNSGFGQSSRIYIAEYPKPKLKSHCLLIETYASAVNPVDWKFIARLNQMIPRLGPIRPFILGNDVAGVVVDKGSAVTGFEVGDSVYGMSVYPTTGTLAEYVLLDYRQAALKPANLSYGEAAGVPLAALTALQALQAAEAGPESKVLILGASGGVGTFATQIAKALGAEVTGLCGKTNLELVRSLGADRVIDYTQPGYSIPSNYFDVVFDAVSLYSLSKCSSHLKNNGTYVVSLGNARSTFDLFRDKLSHGNRRAEFVIVNANTRDLNTLKTYIEAGKVKPIIDSEYSFDEVEQAYRRSKTGRVRGKIVIHVKPKGVSSKLSCLP
jgi:alcohol dehydrogenase